MVVLLLVLAPLPEGSAYPWALAVVECIIFGLIAVWQFALARGEDSHNALARDRQFLTSSLSVCRGCDCTAGATAAGAASNRFACNLPPL